MARSKNRQSAEVNAGSMADIAFLLLIFFLVTTTIASDKGLTLVLPPKQDNQQQQDLKLNERNLFKVLVNSSDKLLVEGKPMDDYHEIKPKLKKFILNYGKDPELSESPQKAVVSFKADRGTSYEMYINVLDQLQGAYYEIYGARVGLTADEYRNLDQDNPSDKALYEKGKEGIPMAISIAEPTKVGK